MNLWTWAVSHVLADQKFLSIFSMLFGAGVCVFADRALAKTGHAAGLHYRRTFWLLLFGLMHAHLLWYGDILVPYALCALWVYLFRNRSARTLFITGVLVMSVSSIFYLLIGFGIEQIPARDVASLMELWAPDAELIAAEISAYQGGWLGQMATRSGEALFLETSVFLTIFLWRAGGMMLIGMAFYKWGVLSAEKSDGFYWKLAAAGAMVGLSLIGLGLMHNFEHDFALEHSMFIGSQFNYWGSVFLAFVYVGLIMLMVRRNVFTSLQARLTAIGKTAFSNYILQTVICTLIFYGHGLGLFAEVLRYQQLLIVFGVWALQLWLAPLWLARYGFGPIEWAWRSLTYWHRQPMVL